MNIIQDMHIYIYTYEHTHLEKMLSYIIIYRYMCIWIGRQRERERERELHIPISLCFFPFSQPGLSPSRPIKSCLSNMAARAISASGSKAEMSMGKHDK